jgi:hypothetical protein
MSDHISREFANLEDIVRFELKEGKEQSKALEWMHTALMAYMLALENKKRPLEESEKNTCNSASNNI